jgi:hypothetical protein
MTSTNSEFYPALLAIFDPICAQDAKNIPSALVNILHLWNRTKKEIFQNIDIDICRKMLHI